MIDSFKIMKPIAAIRPQKAYDEALQQEILL